MDNTKPSEPASDKRTDGGRAPQKFVIVGGGTAGWMVAAALARFASNISVTLVESDTIGTVGVGEATIPQIHLFNSALGFPEAEFVRETKATFKLGIEFDGWLREGEAYMHAFGGVGRPIGLLPFQHYWVRAKHAGFAKPLQRFSLNELAARTMRMQRGKASPDVPEMPYAYHFDAGLYAAYLRRFAEAGGVTRTEGLVTDVERDGESGDISAIVLEGGARIAGDFFIDCTGFRALLIEGALGAGFHDWSEWLRCDRALAVPCEAKGDFSPYTRSIARKAGWQWRIPLQHRIGNGHVYSSAHLSDDEAADALLANLDGKPSAEPRLIRFQTGMRAKQWSHNCLALGLAAGFMEPLESTSIHLIQSSISRFLAMLPSGRPSAAMIDGFNRQAEFEWSRIRDFLILHYQANSREGEAFWDGVRAMDVPDSLQHKREQWLASSFIHREHEELFTDVGWFQVFVGQGLIPESYNPMADQVPDTELRALMDEIETRNVAAVKTMPRHLDFTREMVASSLEAGVTQ